MVYEHSPKNFPTGDKAVRIATPETPPPASQFHREGE